MKHIVILKAKGGEFDALKHLDIPTADRITPLFDIGRIKAETYNCKYMQESGAPIQTYLDRVIAGIATAWPTRATMLDMYQWAPDATVESGDHVLSYMVDSLTNLGVSVLPVVGYDRWQAPIYKLALSAMFHKKNRDCCIRLDNSAF